MLGASGFIGVPLLVRLKQEGYFVTGVVRDPNAVARLPLEPDPKVVEQYQHVMIHAVLARNGVINGMDWHCSR